MTSKSTNLFYNKKIKINTRTGEEAYKDYTSIKENESKVSKKQDKKQVTPVTASAGFSLEDLTDFYRINGVNYRDGIYQVDLSKKISESKTQDQYADQRNNIISNNSDEFYIADYPLFHNIILSLNQNKDNPIYKEKIEEARLFIKDTSLKFWLTMLTRVQYNPKPQKDIVIHNYKQKDEYRIELDSFIGPNGYITHISNIEQPLHALLNTKQSINKINNVYKWLVDVDSYIWRVNSEVKNPVETVARFSADSGGADFGCSGDPSSSDRALLVRSQKIFQG